MGFNRGRQMPGPYEVEMTRELTEEVLANANVSGNLLNRRILKKAGAAEIIIMHPLPRDSRAEANELDPDLNENPNLAIFRQTDNGVLIRMAIFLTTLGCSADAVKATIKQRPWDATLRWN